MTGDAALYVVPGRVELVGKHVDYAGGRSLTCATSMAIRARSTRLGDRVAVVDAPAGAPYARAVARRFFRDFPRARSGVSLALTSDLPQGAGLSSSSALVVALAMALRDVNSMDADAAWQSAIPTPIAFAAYCAAMETGEAYGSFHGDPGVGVRGGAQDHVAVLCSRDGCIGQFSYLPPRQERYVSWPAGFVLAIAVSGVVATKTGNALGAYNSLSDAMRAGTRAEGSDRVAQFREESEEIVPGVGDALRDGDYARMGALVDRSQELAERVLQNQVPETIFLARESREGGAVAASAFGAGFGGAVWAMVREADAARFVGDLGKRYEEAFPRRDGAFHLTRPGGPARVEAGP